VQVCGEGGVGVGAGVDRVIVVVFLGDRNPLCSSELLFQVTSNGLLLPSEGGGDDSLLLLIDEEVGGNAWHGRQDSGGGQR
jgi:hypothetical protein